MTNLSIPSRKSDEELITLVEDFPAFDAAESQTLDIIGARSNYPKISGIRLWSKDGNDPGADTNVNCRLSFYKRNTYTEDQLICDFYFNLVYTEVKAQIEAGATSGDIDSTEGLVKYDFLRFTGNTAENVNISAITDSDTLAFTATSYPHIVDEGVVKITKITERFDLYDANRNKEIHVKLEMFSSPGNSVQVTIEIDLRV